MVKLTKIMCLYIKTIFWGVKGLKVLFQPDFVLHGDLYCCVKYSIVEYQVEIFKIYHLKVMLKSEWLNMILNVDLMTLNILKLEFFIFL